MYDNFKCHVFLVGFFFQTIQFLNQDNIYVDTYSEVDLNKYQLTKCSGAYNS